MPFQSWTQRFPMQVKKEKIFNWKLVYILKNLIGTSTEKVKSTAIQATVSKSRQTIERRSFGKLRESGFCYRDN